MVASVRRSRFVTSLRGRLRIAVAWSSKVVYHPANVAWRVLLIAAASAMMVGGALQAMGNPTLSDTVVTAGFALGILAVPTWLVAMMLDRVAAISQKAASHED